MRRALLGVVLAIGAAAPAQAAFPGTNGRISFSSEGDIWSASPDGSGLRNLTQTPDADEAQSVFSPDGSRIAYRRRPAEGAAYQLYVMTADGGAQTRVSHSTVNETQPAFTPDGARLIYRRTVVGDPAGEVWSVRLDGTDARQLVDTPGFDERYPVSSPDGTRLAFTSNRDGQYELYVSAADGSAPVRLTTDPGYDSAPTWSPDGRRFAFERGDELDADTTKDIWTMAADGSGQTRLTPDDAFVDEGPAFSPDGEQIAFTSSRDGNYEPYRMNADGSGAAPVVVRPATKEESLDWQPVPASPPPPPSCFCQVPAPPPVVTPPFVPPARPPAAKPVPADQDHDGISAGRERARGTSDLDRDSDDDGLGDARELTRTGTSPRRRDTDGDGLPDGLELGVVRPVTDPSGSVRGTARSRFRRDADPRSHTNPLRRDTDRDGRADGREDADRDGRRDPGESDPRRR